MEHSKLLLVQIWGNISFSENCTYFMLQKEMCPVEVSYQYSNDKNQKLWTQQLGNTWWVRRLCYPGRRRDLDIQRGMSRALSACPSNPRWWYQGEGPLGGDGLGAWGYEGGAPERGWCPNEKRQRPGHSVRPSCRGAAREPRRAATPLALSSWTSRLQSPEKWASVA